MRPSRWAIAAPPMQQPARYQTTVGCDIENLSNRSDHPTSCLGTREVALCNCHAPAQVKATGSTWALSSSVHFTASGSLRPRQRRCPSARQCSATDRPIPRLAPVIRTVRDIRGVATAHPGAAPGPDAPSAARGAPQPRNHRPPLHPGTGEDGRSSRTH